MRRFLCVDLYSFSLPKQNSTYYVSLAIVHVGSQRIFWMCSQDDPRLCKTGYDLPHAVMNFDLETAINLLELGFDDFIIRFFYFQVAREPISVLHLRHRQQRVLDSPAMKPKTITCQYNVYISTSVVRAA